MKKEKLTLANITEDLKQVAAFQISCLGEWRLVYIMPITLISVFFGIVFKNLWIALLIFSMAAYHIVKYIIAFKEYTAKKKALRDTLRRENLSISMERLSHIDDETVYEPYMSRRYAHYLKEVTFFYFASGWRWRLPNCQMHYQWSEEYPLSPEGLENISVSGDEFFRVSLQDHHDIAYIYPCKYFVLDVALKASSSSDPQPTEP